MAPSRTIIIGDVHGCFSELSELMAKLRATAKDRIIFVGDLIAKGPASRKVLEYVQRRKNCETIVGNHEYLLTEHYLGRRVRLDPAHREVIEDLGKDYIRHMDWMAELPSFIDLGDYVVVHAGVRPGKALRRQSRLDLAFLRTLGGKPASRSGTPWFDRYRGRRTVVFGHWVFRAPMIGKRVIGLDTGCVYGGSLTALVLPAGRIVQVKAHKTYAKKERR